MPDDTRRDDERYHSDAQRPGQTQAGQPYAQQGGYGRDYRRAGGYDQTLRGYDRDVRGWPRRPRR